MLRKSRLTWSKSNDHIFKVVIYSLSAVILLSLTFNTIKSDKVEIEIEFEKLSENASFGPRDHESIVQYGTQIYVYGGFFRGGSAYQELLRSSDYGLSWIRLLGNEKPRLNDLETTILGVDSDLPSAFARFLEWNSSLYLVDGSLWQLENQNLIKVKDNFFEEIESASELNILYTKTGVVLIDPSIGKLWVLNKELKLTLSKELKFQGKTLRVRGATVFENHGSFFIYGGELLGKGSQGTSMINNLSLKSIDGINWLPIENSPQQKNGFPFSKFIWSCTVNDSKGRTWVIGGYDLQNAENTSFVWVSLDGIKFSVVPINVKDDIFSPRHALGCVYLEEQKSILIIGGKGGLEVTNDKSWVLNDIWYLKLL
jgi:hypothetical protein